MDTTTLPSEFCAGDLPRSLFDLDPLSNVPVKLFIKHLFQLPTMIEDGGMYFKCTSRL